MSPGNTKLQQDELIRIRRWFSSRLGQQLVATEQAIIDPVLSGLFGYHLLQVSLAGQEMYGSSPVGHKFTMDLTPEDSTNSLVGPLDKMPFADDSLDVVLLHHMLDFYESPHPILREAARVVIPSGYLLVVGFNPWSIWGLWKNLMMVKKTPPWNSASVSPGRLMDWLTLLDFKIDRAIYGFYRAPVQTNSQFKLPDYSHGLSRKINWPFGAVYVIVARKQVSSLTPIQPRWKKHSLKQVSGAQSLNRVKTTRENVID